MISACVCVYFEQNHIKKCLFISTVILPYAATQIPHLHFMISIDFQIKHKSYIIINELSLLSYGN